MNRWDVWDAYWWDAWFELSKGGVMTKEQINREVAEKVMGFTKHGEHSWLNPNDGEIWFFDEFNPAERIGHAWMVVEKFDSWTLEKSDTSYRCTIGTCFWSNTAPMAICFAALEAVKEEP